MVTVVYILKCKHPEQEDLMEVLRLVTSRTQYAPGCTETGIWMNDENSELMVYEVWRSKEDFSRHVNSPLYIRLLAALEMSAEKPVVRISECENFRGIDLIEEVIVKRV